ncbi:GntR family transcriptional regulator [Flavihumibacter petaseus]|uniref:Putative GntR family transcriptional regulator n=1 Tax=Flavihumibacter petaseus NBRC 106054 TaxID=1220578 RepID=A0A0E9N0N2_9BACT|nr:GntR family transcriptional regulator [Flavihumibacter petaseus]GAO42910.1 putative GntR family transcriptional regulator [Flavihumibacter petaseus NBRC 106054]
MQTWLHIENDLKTPKYLQVVKAIMAALRKGKLKKGDPLLSINELSDELLVSRDTIQRAYQCLREKGVIISVRGKGFFIHRADAISPYRILLLFNKISNYKKQVYTAFLQTMGDRAHVDLQIHHSDARVFERQVNHNLNDFDYYVVMPHFYEEQEIAIDALKRIPPAKLVLLDKDIYGIREPYAAVIQDFRNNIYEALVSGSDLLQKYQQMVLVFPRLVPYPEEILAGFRLFCAQQNMPFEVIGDTGPDMALPEGTAFVVIEENDLVNLVKASGVQHKTIGKDIGILSYNETPLKEILLDGITVLSTDHAAMGEHAARLILENRREKIKNPFQLIRRKSL